MPSTQTASRAEKRQGLDLDADGSCPFQEAVSAPPGLLGPHCCTRFQIPAPFPGPITMCNTYLSYHLLTACTLNTHFMYAPSGQRRRLVVFTILSQVPD